MKEHYPRWFSTDQSGSKWWRRWLRERAQWYQNHPSAVHTTERELAELAYALDVEEGRASASPGPEVVEEVVPTTKAAQWRVAEARRFGQAESAPAAAGGGTAPDLDAGAPAVEAGAGGGEDSVSTACGSDVAPLAELDEISDGGIGADVDEDADLAAAAATAQAAVRMGF